MTLALSCEVVHEKLWKSVNICKSYSKKISGTFFPGHGVYSTFIVVPHTQGAQVRITQSLPANYTVPASTS